MELYFAPFACSLASHIVAREAGIDVTLRPVALAAKQLADGGDYLAVSPKGYVPALRLDDGTVLSENPAVLQYLAELRPDAALLPAAGRRDRYAVLEWVGYVSTEIHKGIFAPIFNPDAPEAAKVFARSLAERKIGFVAAQLGERPFLVGDHFTIADAYLTWALILCPHAGIVLAPWPALQAYLTRMQQRPAVAAAIAAEQRPAA